MLHPKNAFVAHLSKLSNPTTESNGIQIKPTIHSEHRKKFSCSKRKIYHQCFSHEKPESNIRLPRITSEQHRTKTFNAVSHASVP